MNKGGKQWHAALHFSGLNTVAYGALKVSVKNTWLTQQVNDVPKSYTETANIADQFLYPKTDKRASVSTQPRVAFMQTGQTLPNNRKIGKSEKQLDTMHKRQKQSNGATRR